MGMISALHTTMSRCVWPDLPLALVRFLNTDCNCSQAGIFALGALDYDLCLAWGQGYHALIILGSSLSCSNHPRPRAGSVALNIKITDSYVRRVLLLKLQLDGCNTPLVIWRTSDKGEHSV